MSARPVRDRRWRVAQADPAAAAGLARALDVPPLLASLLIRRGCDTPEAARTFLDAPLAALHDPRQMLGMDAAVDRLRVAVTRREPILVCGDYDVDGVSGVALLVSGLRRAGGEVEYAVPRRLEHGYGLHVSIAEQAAAGGVRVLVTVDHGITALEAVALARQRGMDVIICDHHLPPPSLPPATAILNPRQADCPYPFKDLCGVGIAFKLLQGLFGPEAEDELWPSLDLVALGTIADLVPLLGENRILVKHGLVQLAGTARPGLRALAEVAGIPLSRQGGIAAGRVAFGLAPRINAAGRLDDAAAAVRLLLTHDPSEARELATTLDRQNRERQELEGSILAEALAQAVAEHDLTRDRAIVLASPAWHPGVIGIVASRLVERFGRPTALIGTRGQEARGSARSAGGWHIADALGRCADLLLQYGGHRAAAGFSIHPDRIDAFRARFLSLAAEELTEEDLLPTLAADAEVHLDALDLALADSLARLGPYGVGNPEPLLVARRLQVMRTPRQVGQNHLKMKVRESSRGGQVMEAIGFNLGSFTQVLSQASAPQVDLAFVPERNVWNDREILQLRVKDLHILPGP
ncbi:MAG: single-stranded-DNA-specific exonuclease RecJ [candidate division NC10 bacterium]|nr:single-stranded-DNA-specific exonuclease RecJ [candidate division NC10 bacterium]MBI2116048.1 single-stranded-DNA-specific exonuclease RecJ [candidate division NC10 bacterium]